MVEFPVHEKSELAGKLLSETQLREREIVVLNIDRNGTNFPNPVGSHRINAGDVLLCYGKFLALKSVVPPRQRRRRTKKKSGRSAETRS